MGSASASAGLELVQEGGVVWARLDRPEERNALDLETRTALTELFVRANVDASIRVIVIIGNERDFCTGASLDPMVGADGQPLPPLPPIDYRWTAVEPQLLFKALWEVEKPVVSAVTGTVAGVGWMLALLADLVVAAEDARWTHVFARRGMAAHGGDPAFLPHIVPFHVLNEIALLSDTMTSVQLERWGLVNRVVPAGAVKATARELATRLSRGPTLSLGQTKRLYRRALVPNVEAALEEQRMSSALLSATSDPAEGLRAFREGRAPDFDGR
jgi:2-(1,2-epoxy-1,2-dihydrophenyl)acetyl-CoA isomerase